ncbi:MAG: hypothetical protein ACP5KE_02550 [Candidatus Methanodesulfokora sp.]|nr:MAG: hypothetical protein C0200_02260 [Candidatus Korarchaeota archaeon]
MEGRYPLVGVASKLRPVDEKYREISNRISSMFHPLGLFFDVPTVEEAAVLVMTGGTEDVIERIGGNWPLLLIYHDSENSLPAAIEATSSLRKRGRVVWIAHWSSPEIPSILSAIRAIRRIRGFRLGIIGDPSPWLTYSRSSDDDLRRIGITPVHIPIKALVEEYTKIGSESSENDLVNARRMGEAINKLMTREKLDGITIRCFDLLDLGTTACLALSELNSAGKVAGCEADIPAFLAMLLGYLLSEKPTFMGNVAKVDEEGIVLAHCTFPLSIAERYKFMTHFESGKGVGIAAEVKKGVKATIMRISDDLRKIRVIKGVTDEIEWRSDLCRTQIRVKTEGDPSIIMRRPMGNHHVISFADISRELFYLADALNIEYEII